VNFVRYVTKGLHPLLAPSRSLLESILPYFSSWTYTRATHRVHSIMAKAKSRLLTHAPELSRSRHRFSTLTNTSKRVRKVFTESTSSSSFVEQQNQPEEALLDNVQPMVVDDLNGTLADIGHPANISVRAKAKRYQNSVRQCYPFIEFSRI